MVSFNLKICIWRQKMNEYGLTYNKDIMAELNKAKGLVKDLTNILTAVLNNRSVDFCFIDDTFVKAQDFLIMNREI